MDALTAMEAAKIASNPCGANILCGDQQNIFAYAGFVGSRTTDVTGAERAIGARIREARERLGVSITELGLAWGKNRQTVQFWERGAHFPPLSELTRLCQLLRTDANALLGFHAMKPLTDQEIVHARTHIRKLAEVEKQAVVQRQEAKERLQRRRSA